MTVLGFSDDKPLAMRVVWFDVVLLQLSASVKLLMIVYASV